ncbi:MAG: MMPL family transporter, partial [Candidatus Latescibacteria bacterium]|nr:MMPL family transporter [Candidatus Latescibacterota bacterium]
MQQDRVVQYGQWLIKRRWPVLFGMLLIAVAAMAGVMHMQLKNEYRVFFGEDNPQLQAFDKLEKIYTKNDNVLLVIAPKDGNVFSSETLSVVENLTHEAWQIPYAIRVDGVTNFQHTRAEEDDLIVADLVIDAKDMDQAALDNARQVAISDARLVNYLIPKRAHVTGINVTLQLPANSPQAEMDAVTKTREMIAKIEAENPQIDFYLTGFTMLNNAFQESSMQDMQSLVPLMYLGIFGVMGVLLRSVSGTLSTGVVIILSMGTGLGLAGWLGLPMTPPASAAPTIIMTLAVADSIHVLVTLLQQMRLGHSKQEAIVESLRVNMLPVFLTSLTTVIGFLSMNFSDVPPLNDLGNMTALGVVAAFVYSVTLLPVMMAILPLRVKVKAEASDTQMDHLANWVIAKRNPLLWSAAFSVLVLGAFLPSNDLNDQFVKYFDESTDFRKDTDFAMANLSGIYQIHYSVGAERSNGISDPVYLNRLEAFATWFRQQPGVVHVNTLSETMKTLNMNMHADDPAYYRLPESTELAAQYLLLYEMSLPYGLDLNNQINVDKSATRLMVTLENVTTKELRYLVEAGEQWLTDEAPPYMFAKGIGPGVMFAYVSDRNIKSMLIGTVLAFILIAIVLMVALRSWRFGLISFLPNLVPAVLGFGIWGVFVGEINLGLSVVVGMTLGIVVDDTVHFLSKYLRARREH